MSALSPTGLRRFFPIATGIAIVGLAVASPASTRVDPAPLTVSNLTATTTSTTTVTGGQSNPHSATFTFGSSSAASGFECEVDGSGFATCATPYTADHLAYGTHTIRVRAVNAAGNVDPTPAAETFAIAAPTVTSVKTEWGPVVYAPDSVAVTSADTTTMTIAWSAVGRSTDAISYRVSRNGVLIETDTGLSATMTGLGCGRTYTVSVAAVDAAGDASSPTSIMASTVQCRTPAVPVTLSIPRAIGPGVALSATATGSIRTVSFGYCPGQTCTWATSTLIGSVSGPGQADVWWASPPPDGTYTVVVRAVDVNGATGDANPAVVSVDTTSPDATIASGPAGFSSTTATFGFASSEAVSRFECDVDGSGFFPCLASFSLSGLSGSHTLAVRAVDLAGNVDPAPATNSWTVDVDPPDTTLLSDPPPLTPVDAITFVLGSTEPGSFQCKLDNAGTFTACPAPLTYSGLSSGAHKLTARAVDRAGNADPTPLVLSWSANAPTNPPETTITSAPPALVNTRGVLVSFSSNNPIASFLCSVDGAAFVACLNPRPINNLADGPHTFRVEATLGGLTDTTPATTSFTVDATAPTVTVTPSRAADGAGWYRNAVSFTTTGTDAGGAVTCSGPQSYSGPDVSHLSIIGSCTDAAGNKASKTFDLRYDTTAPAIRVAFRVRDRNTWYNAPVSVFFDGTDAMSGGVTCDAPVDYAGPDSGATSVTGNCMDAAGNIAPATLPLQYDATPPTVTALAGRVPDHNGWYNAPASVTFAGQDATSGGVSCDPARLYAGPDTADAAIVGTCSDAAGNYASGSLHLAYDATAPTVTVDPSRVADHNGWFNSAVTFTTHGSDTTSGLVDCTLPVTYFAPDTAAGSLSGSCSDAAGNTATRNASFKYDSTAPTARAIPDSQPNLNGWYRTTLNVSFAGTDATSGPVTCSAASSYSGPDSAAASLSGSCADQAGNSSPAASYAFKYDATAPSVSALLSRVADKNGWYNHSVDASFSGADATSKGVTCTGATYNGADNAAASLSGSCTDAAGNSGSASIGFKYDATGPTVTATPARAANANGWYRASIGVNFTGADAFSGVAACDAPASYAGPDTAATTLSGSCTDLAGNSGSGSFTLKYDATAPTVNATLGRAPDSGTWYNHGVSAGFSGTDALSGGVTCDAAKSYAGPDSATASLSGSCTDAAGNQGTATKAFPYDTTAPAVTLTPDRAPDAGGAYNAPVTYTVTGTDATSNGVTCDGPKPYSGPDSSTAVVNGTCVDAAGNQGTGSVTFVYSTTAPDTSLISTPAPLTNHTTDQFVFASTKTLSTFHCTIDTVTSGCTSPATVTGLTDGQHTFSVAATDSGGNTDPTPATFTWTVDTVAPDTTFDTTTLLDPTNRAQSFTIATAADATLECSLDNAAFTACVSPFSVPLSSTPDGSHTFRARGVDGAGNIDATPASFTWTVDTSIPTVTLTSTPASIALTTSATFGWTTNETAAFSCRIDTNAFASCGTGTSGTKTFSGLTQGPHTFNIRARDGAGNITPLPGVAYNWTVDTGPPDTTIDPASKPANPTSSASASFTFSATEPSTFKCKLDNAASFTTCTSPQSYTLLTTGSHTFAVEAVDSVGNVDPTPDSYTWLVDTTSPTGALTAPVNGATVSGTTAVTTSANDNVSVLNVQFKLDGADLGLPVTAAPYTVNWDTTVSADGPHVLTAVIKDEVGNVTTTASVSVTVSNTTHPVATQSPDLVNVGPGSVDATTRNVIRTSAGRVYIIADDDSAAVSNPIHTPTGPGLIRAYKGNQVGTPTAFAEADTVHHPVSGSTLTAFGGVDVRLGSDGIAHTVYNDNSFGTPLIYRTFSTVTDTWGAAENITTGVGTMDRGRIRFAMALDAANVPHVVWVTGCTSSSTCSSASGGETLNYSNRAGGTWSAPVAIATGKPLHPMLAFDSSGVLHVSWLEDNGTASTIKYATRTGGTWSAPETVPTTATGVLSNGNADQGPSIATDSAGHPYVLYVGASQGTFGPAGHTALYGAIKVTEKVNGTWTDVSPATDMLTHTPQVYLHGNDLYAFTGHDTDLNFGYNRKLAGQAWGSATKLTATLADGSASIRWDPLHETDASIIDTATFDEDRLHDKSFLPELYYMAVKPSVADTSPPTVSLTAPAAGTVTGTVTVSADASDNIGVAGVTFMLDGSSIAPEDPTSPYSFNWNTATATNGTHSLTAVARDAAGNTTTSTAVSVTVSNATPAPTPSAVLFGSTTIFTPTDTNVPGAMEAFDVGTVTAGTLARLHVFLDTPLPPTLLLALYDGTATTPAALLSTTTIVTPVAGWNDVAFGPLAITAGKHYWLGLLTPTGLLGGPHFRDARTGGAGMFVNGPSLSTFPTAWPTGGTPNTDGPLATWGNS